LSQGSASSACSALIVVTIIRPIRPLVSHNPWHDADVPELPEVEAVRRRLEVVMRGRRIKRVLLRRKDLRRPFPRAFASRLAGRRIRAVNRRGKYLTVDLDSGETLLMHLGMSGSFRIERKQQRVVSRGQRVGDLHDHVVFTLSNGVTVTFNDPRRFGLMDLVSGRHAASNDALASLGPEPLAASFDAAAIARSLAGKRMALKLALLDQRVVAGLGNIYASEALHLASLSPLRRCSTIATGGRPNSRAVRLASAIKTVLHEAIARQERPCRAGRFRVYEREGEPCRTPGCHGTIRRISQASRSTFYCPSCQR